MKSLIEFDADHTKAFNSTWLQDNETPAHKHAYMMYIKSVSSYWKTNFNLIESSQNLATNSTTQKAQLFRVTSKIMPILHAKLLIKQLLFIAHLNQLVPTILC